MEYWRPKSLASLEPTTGLCISFCVGTGIDSSGGIVKRDRTGRFKG